MEREHQKEKQKLVKDKDAGAFMRPPSRLERLDIHPSEKPTHEG